MVAAKLPASAPTPQLFTQFGWKSIIKGVHVIAAAAAADDRLDALFKTQPAKEGGPGHGDPTDRSPHPPSSEKAFGNGVPLGGGEGLPSFVLLSPHFQAGVLSLPLPTEAQQFGPGAPQGGVCVCVCVKWEADGGCWSLSVISGQKERKGKRKCTAGSPKGMQGREIAPKAWETRTKP